MTRLTAEHRRAQIVQAAMSLSYQGGLYEWTLDDVAKHVGVSRPTVAHYFYSAVGLRAEIITKAITDRDVEIVTQALAKCDPLVDGLDVTLRMECAEFMSGGTD